MFDLDIMVCKYRQLLLSVAPPIILVDMDGTLVDWDKGFRQEWQERSLINRRKSYYMEDCVPLEYECAAQQINLTELFFENLEPVPGAIEVW